MLNPAVNLFPKTVVPKSNKTSSAKPKRRARKPKTEPTPAPPEAVVSQNGSHVALVVSTGTQTASETTVTTKGSNSFGRPQKDIIPNSEQAVLAELLSKDAENPQEELEPLSQTVIGLKSLVSQITKGEDISAHRALIAQVAANQPEKGDVVRAYVNQANYELLADYVEIRANGVRHIKRASRRDDVQMTHAIVCWKLANEQIDRLVESSTKNDKAVDTTTVIEKIDYHRQQVERTVQTRWEGTTPQGRELIRKKLWEIERRMKAEKGIHPTGMEPPEPPEDEPEPEPVEEASVQKPA